MSERIRTDAGEASPELSPEAAASYERDRLIRNSPEVLRASQQPIGPQRQQELSEAVGRTAVAAQQREQRQQELAPKIGQTAIAAQRSAENRAAVMRQLGHKAVEREAHRTRD